MKRNAIAACMALMVAAGSVTGCSSQTGTKEMIRRHRIRLREQRR